LIEGRATPREYDIYVGIELAKAQHLEQWTQSMVRVRMLTRKTEQLQSMTQKREHERLNILALRNRTRIFRQLFTKRARNSQS
jgi:hypothetical protein